ncbi:MAG: PAS-domain containing protein, partial [Alphaproteobacteria bacterium]
MSEPGASALSPRMLAELFARFPNGAFVLDAERRLVACNDLCASMFGRAAECLVPGESFREVLRCIVARAASTLSSRPPARRTTSSRPSETRSWAAAIQAAALVASPRAIPPRAT